MKFKSTYQKSTQRHCTLNITILARKLRELFEINHHLLTTKTATTTVAAMLMHATTTFD